MSRLRERNQHLPGIDPVERRIRLPELLDAKLVYAASVHRLSPSELIEQILVESLRFDLPAVPAVVVPTIVPTRQKLRTE